MEVILQENIRNLGKLGQRVNVKPGYARNYLIPQGKALTATTDNLADFEKRRAELEKAAGEHLLVAQRKAEEIGKLATITITAKAAEEGTLYGSIGTPDIADAVQKAGVEIERSEISMPTGNLRQIGEYTLDIQLHPDVVAKIHIHIVAE